MVLYQVVVPVVEVFLFLEIFRILILLVITSKVLRKVLQSPSFVKKKNEKIDMFNTYVFVCSQCTCAEGWRQSLSLISLESLYFISLIWSLSDIYDNNHIYRKLIFMMTLIFIGNSYLCIGISIKKSSILYPDL